MDYNNIIDKRTLEVNIMEKVEFFYIVERVAKFYADGTGGSFCVYRIKNGIHKFLVCWGHPLDEYSRYWTDDKNDALEYAQFLAS